MKRTIFLLLFVYAFSAGAFDLAPPKLPSRDPVIVLPLLRALPLASTYQAVCQILGKPDMDVGSASPDARFTLIDGSHIRVMTQTKAPDLVFMVRTITLYPAQRAAEEELLLDVTPKT